MTTQRRDGSSISVIIPAYKAAAGLESTLLSLAAQQPIDWAISILVANDGNDAAVTEVCRNYGVSMVAIAPRHGSYFARNCALEKAAGELIAFIDAGIWLPKDWLAKAIEALGTADYLAGEVDISDVARPTAAQAYEMSKAYPIADYMRIFHFGGAGNLIVTKDLLKKVGGFEHRLYSGGDAEFGDRVYRAGLTQVYLAEPVLLHPPRRALAFFRKQFRVKTGYGHLTRLYPGRFPRKGILPCLLGLLRSFLPPHPMYIRSEFPSGTTVPAWRRFLFLWALKICRAAAELIAVLVPAPRPRRSSPRIECFDFPKATG